MGGVAYVVSQARLDTVHPPVLALIGGPVVAGVAALAYLPTWRRIVRAVPQTWLVGGQVYRTIGAIFLLLWARGDLPA